MTNKAPENKLEDTPTKVSQPSDNKPASQNVVTTDKNSDAGLVEDEKVSKSPGKEKAPDQLEKQENLEEKKSPKIEKEQPLKEGKQSAPPVYTDKKQSQIAKEHEKAILGEKKVKSYDLDAPIVDLEPKKAQAQGLSSTLNEQKVFPQKAEITDKTTALIEDPPLPKRRTPSGGFYIECFIREVITNIRRNPMMSVASISTVMVLAMILGTFVVIVANLEALAAELAGEMQIKVYMADSFNPEEANEFKGKLMDIGHVTKATFVAKDEAFRRLRERLNTKLDLDDLDHNPLPDAFEVPVDDPKFLEPVAHKIAMFQHVATVDYGREEAKNLMTLNHIVRLVGFVILIMLFASTLLIISNTIRLTVFARRKEIDIMQLVGAADWFIRWPFILEGVTQGLVGASLAALLIDCSYRIVVPQIHHSISFLPILEPNSIMPFLNIGLILLGCIVGALGSLISVNRHLKI